MSRAILPPYLAWRDGRPRWVPGPRLRPHFKGRDLKDAADRWLGLEAAIAAATELNAEVAIWKAGGQPRRRPRPVKVTRSCRALWDRYRATPEFRMLAANTQADYTVKAGVFLRTFGDEPVESLGRAILKGYWRGLYDSQGHSMANGILAVVRLLLTFASDEEWIEANPAYKLKLKSVPPRVAFWSPPKAAAFVATADALGLDAVGDAAVIALHSAQRRGDVLALPERLFESDRLLLTQFKTGALVDAPMTPPLRDRIARIRARQRAAGVAAYATIVTNPATGKPYGNGEFRRDFDRVRAEAVARYPELDVAERLQPALRDLRFQDFRDTAITRLAMARCTLPHVAAISGHSPEHITSVIKHYLAINAALADEAIRLLTEWLQTEGIAV